MSREVVEFIVVPPFDKRAAVAGTKERLENWLGHRFPGYTFKVSVAVPVGDEERFTVLPVMNFLGDDGQSYMCEPPKLWLLREIADTCQSYRFRSH